MHYAKIDNELFVASFDFILVEVDKARTNKNRISLF